MPMINLTREAGMKIGPVLLETLVKHYFERILKDGSQNKDLPQLMQDELLYDEAFNVIKAFLEASSKHTVEELQWFSNVRTPSPPWVHVVKTRVPMSCCDDAAVHLIKALGGEEVTKRVVGGTKWWQVRGVKGIDAEWVSAKKDWHEAKRRYKAQQKGRPSTSEGPKSRPSTSNGGVRPDASENYQPEMDEMRCILYAHGGGYYFGSVDQERYSIQRHARKINGRVFAMNYRLAPQYPFPCAIQDLLAAYLFLIEPPEGSSHLKVSPAHIVVAGDSAGGGLCIALLQVIRDAGLPMPAGGVLISPWCDLTHSFPSISTNTATDVMPPYGLSLYKPSTLWPPPPDEITATVHATVRERVRQALHLKSTLLGVKHNFLERGRPSSSPSPIERKPLERKNTEEHFTGPTPKAEDHDVQLPPPGPTLHLGSSASLPRADSHFSQTVQLKTTDGKVLTIEDQIQLYAPNSLLGHPLICPVASYLGGLPPLFVIASEKEVLRDEIIYFAHKAAHPDKYPVKEEARELYPLLNGIEGRGYKPTQVHLQVYDDTAHVLPVLFSFTTPAKYCYRAIASFIKHITGMLPPPPPDPTFSIPYVDSPSNISEGPNPFNKPIVSRSRSAPSMHAGTGGGQDTGTSTSTPKTSHSDLPNTDSTTPTTAISRISKRMSLRKALTATASRVSVILNSSPNRNSTAAHLSAPFPQRSVSDSRLERSTSTVVGSSASGSDGDTAGGRGRENTSDVAGPRFGRPHLREDTKTGELEGVRYAGEVSVYDNGLETMIRERVSTQGVIRALEPEEDLPAFALPPELIGVVSELAMKRYLDGRCKFDKKFRKTVKTIEKVRRRNLEMAHQDAIRNMTQLQTYLEQDDEKIGASSSVRGSGRGRSGSRRNKSKTKDTAKGIREALSTSGSWSWAWALDIDERPPPSSIVSRRDTDEAVRLARIADQCVLMEENMISGNNLWSMIVNFLTVSPDKSNHSLGHGHHYKKEQHEKDEREDEQEKSSSKRERIRSRFAQFVAEQRKFRFFGGKDSDGTTPIQV